MGAETPTWLPAAQRRAPPQRVGRVAAPRVLPSGASSWPPARPGPWAAPGRWLGEGRKLSGPAEWGCFGGGGGWGGGHTRFQHPLLPQHWPRAARGHPRPGAGSFFPPFFPPGAAQAQGLLQPCESRRGRLRPPPPPPREPSRRAQRRPRQTGAGARPNAVAGNFSAERAGDPDTGTPRSRQGPRASSGAVGSAGAAGASGANLEIDPESQVPGGNGTVNEPGEREGKEAPRLLMSEEPGKSRWKKSEDSRGSAASQRETTASHHHRRRPPYAPSAPPGSPREPATAPGGAATGRRRTEGLAGRRPRGHFRNTDKWLVA